MLYFLRRFNGWIRLGSSMGLFFFAFEFFVLAEQVKVSTYYPFPYGNYEQLQIQNQDESPTLNNFRTLLTSAGLGIITDFTVNAYTPGIFWSTLDAPNIPKAGIWMHENASGTRLYFGTSDRFSTGITNTMVLSQLGQLGLGLAAPTLPLAILDVNGVGAHGGGSEASPSFSFGTDLNTGLWSSGADTLDFSTGGTQKMRINSDGNIGVGSNYAPPDPPANGGAAGDPGFSGNMDVNDVWLRNVNGGTGGLISSPSAKLNGSYVGNGQANRLIVTGFHPTRVITWLRHDNGHLHLSQTWEGLPASLGGANFSFHRSDSVDEETTQLRIVAGENGFRVGGAGCHDSNVASCGGTTHYWHAWD